MCEPVQSVDIRMELRLNIGRVKEPTLNVTYSVHKRIVDLEPVVTHIQLGTSCYLSSIDRLSKGGSMNVKWYTSTRTCVRSLCEYEIVLVGGVNGHIKGLDVITKVQFVYLPQSNLDLGGKPSHCLLAQI